ncbi:uncharacterized protein BJX67DRAFT_152820 [Aspergillus lucknowensis]|uniref:SET domain-containing protein n=1 Tax=Aspergillus lucknowensis TaxID=176173 RepID=A0ABR4LNC0_9EURO
MTTHWAPGEEHELFMQWAISQGVIVNGVAPARFPGRGLGMIAKRNIQENEVLVSVPRGVMLTADDIPSSITSRFPQGTPVHALLVAFLCNGNPEDLEPYELWRKTWPTRKDFENCMPILWSESWRNCIHRFDSPSTDRPTLLPPSISGCWKSIQKPQLEFKYESSHQNLLAQQERRLRNAWDSVVAVFPETDWETFSYHWLIVNTRSFFFLMPGQEPPQDRNDAMALLPFADYFNHSDVACKVKFDGQAYVFRAAEAYDAGEEIFMSYGPHPNDFLLTEYGFYLDRNEFEVLYLDDIIFQDLDPTLQGELNLQQYYGNYQVMSSGVCYRTEIAACMRYMSLEDWRNYALGYSTRGVDAQKSQNVIRGWINTYVEEANATIDELKRLEPGKVGREADGRVQMLLKRWRQVKDLCLKALQETASI